MTYVENGFLKDDTGALVVSGLTAVEDLFPGWVAAGDPISWATTPSAFTTTGFTTGTDGGQPSLHLTDESAVSSVLTVRSDIAAARVTVVWRANSTGFSIADTVLGAIVRDVDGTAHLRVDRHFGNGSSKLQPVILVPGYGDYEFDGPLGGDNALDRTDTATYRTMVADVFWDVVRGKTWLAGDAEPGWKGATRSYPISGYGGASHSSAQDNPPETGRAGITALYGGTIRDIIVQPLVRSDAGLFINSKLDPELMAGASQPFGWFHDPDYSDQATDGICEVVTVPGPFGADVQALRVARDTAGSNGGGPMWQQSLYVTNSTDNTSYTRDRPIPTVGAVFPATLHWRAWVKMTGVANSNPGSPKLSLRMVSYYYDGAGTGENIGQTDYYPALGPNDGLGTCGWTLMEGDMPIHDNADIVRLDSSWGLHDQAATGEALMCLIDFELPS